MLMDSATPPQVVLFGQPSEQASPSDADIRVARDLRTEQRLKIQVCNHVIIGREQAMSCSNSTMPMPAVSPPAFTGSLFHNGRRSPHLSKPGKVVLDAPSTRRNVIV